MVVEAAGGARAAALRARSVSLRLAPRTKVSLSHHAQFHPWQYIPIEKLTTGARARLATYVCRRPCPIWTPLEWSSNIAASGTKKLFSTHRSWWRDVRPRARAWTSTTTLAPATRFLIPDDYRHCPSRRIKYIVRTCYPRSKDIRGSISLVKRAVFWSRVINDLRDGFGRSVYWYVSISLFSRCVCEFVCCWKSASRPALVPAGAVDKSRRKVRNNVVCRYCIISLVTGQFNKQNGSIILLRNKPVYFCRVVDIGVFTGNILNEFLA